MRAFLGVVGVLGVVSATGCEEYAPNYAGKGPSEGAPGSADGPSADGSTTAGGVQAGTLTAGAWDDNANFDMFEQYLVDKGTVDGAPPIDDDARRASHDQYKTRTAKTKLDVAIVIDTTGSMGDEMRYLDVELADIATKIAASSQDTRWALVEYKDDDGEEPYVTNHVDFATGVDAIVTRLQGEQASGGGDIPEADERALVDVVQLSWRVGDDVARMAFWIGDAPHHAERAQQMANAIADVHDLDVHLYPVAASGVDDLLELTMRGAAQLTGGRYLFLTDDSGVGDDHAAPHIPCFFVTKLNAAMVRMAAMELSGTRIDPAPDDVIRTGGDPQNGACTLDDGSTVHVL